MKIRGITILLFFVFNVLYAQNPTLPLIPYPNNVSIKEGSFTISPSTKIVLRGSESFTNDIAWFNDYLEKNYGFRLETIPNESKIGNFIQFEYPDFEAGLKENYHLDINKARIKIFYQVQLLEI